MPDLPAALARPALRRGLDRFRRQAETLGRDPGRVRDLVQRSAQKLRKSRRQLGRLSVELPLLLRLARAWARGDYRRLPWRSLVTLLAGVLYFLTPLDLIPDYLPGIGYLDDAAVISYVLGAIRKDVERFRKWERKALPE